MRAARRSTNAELSAETQRRLIAAARELFARRGYAGTGTEDLVAAAHVTRGALYHHYADKKDLFRAVFEAVEQDLGTTIATAGAAETDPWEQMRAGTRAFLAACIDSAVRRIVLLDGPSVLGWEEWRRIDSRFAFGMVRAALEANVAAGNLRPLDLEALTHLYVGSLNEAGLAIAAARDPHATVARFTAVMDEIMNAQRIGATATRSQRARRRSPPTQRQTSRSTSSRRR